MDKITQNLLQVKQRIRIAEERYNRQPNSVQLLAVSKTCTVDKLRSAIAAGQRCFAENYLQEALPKMQLLANEALEWHFIGAIQANKTQLIAEHFAWVHSVSRWKIAQRLNMQRSALSTPLNICLQINISEQATKSGCRYDEAASLAMAISTLSHLRLRGLMAIPAAEVDFSRQSLAYRKVYQLFLELRAAGLDLDTLSLGMSNDLEAAIAEGSTMVRVGTALFGERAKQ